MNDEIHAIADRWARQYGQDRAAGWTEDEAPLASYIYDAIVEAIEARRQEVPDGQN